MQAYLWDLKKGDVVKWGDRQHIILTRFDDIVALSNPVVSDDVMMWRTIESLQLSGYAKVEEVKPETSWRDRHMEIYEQQMGTSIMTVIFDTDEANIRRKKLVSYLKVLAYVEWANEGKEWELDSHVRRCYFVPVVDDEDLRVVITTSMQSPVKLKRRDDADNMLKDPELVEALNLVYNVK
jgi:hypothetical protein